MEKPTECRWCGCSKVWLSRGTVIVFDCGSSWSANDGLEISTKCLTRCADLAIQQRDRIQRAVEVLEGATRFDFIASYMPHMDKRSDGEFIEHDEAEQALEILRGNSPESPDSSPVTADQLATDDYFEAVRQRVPWMTSVQHIEGLVEGYRQCGLMVWKAAKHIEDLFGGKR